MCIQDNIDRLSRCTVKIQIGDKHGTGFFIDTNSILTAEHVIRGAKPDKIQVMLRPPEAGVIQPDIRVQEIVHAVDPNKLDAALLVLDASHLQVGEDFDVVHLLPDWRHDDPVYTYGYQLAERGFHGLPLSGTITDSAPFNGMKLVRFKDDRVAGGLSGAAVLNKHTGAVVGVVKSTDDPNAPIGGYFVPVSEIFLHLPEVFERNRTFFAAVPQHRWRRCEATLLRQHRNASLLKSTAHQWLLIGNGYFPHLAKAHAEVTLALSVLKDALAQLPPNMRPSVDALVDQAASEIKMHFDAARAHPSQSSLLIYWGSRVHAAMPQYQVLHHQSTGPNHAGNIHLHMMKQWIAQLVLADKSVFLVLDLSSIATPIKEWLEENTNYFHPCVAFVGWVGDLPDPPPSKTLAEPLKQAIHELYRTRQDVTAQAVANQLCLHPDASQWVVQPPERDFTLLPRRI